jgi:hypothetical protein
MIDNTQILPSFNSGPAFGTEEIRVGKVRGYFPPGPAGALNNAVIIQP